ncbi:hypothetical protein SO802_009119 [Lithocarpus litseifolius]|uniref:Uncharacterized protein n=1 Tax=Lithocarpus litseifolius TaxID=425828 RepID=A0AAW2DB26_9ROSI
MSGEVNRCLLSKRIASYSRPSNSVRTTHGLEVGKAISAEMLNGEERRINRHKLRSIEMEPTTPHNFKMNRALANRVSFGIVTRDSNGAVMVACRDQLPLRVINYRWQFTYH